MLIIPTHSDIISIYHQKSYNELNMINLIDGVSHMKWYKLIAPAAIGMTVGTLIGRKVTNQWLNPEVALKKVKEAFKTNGPISGSWILMEREEFSKEDELYHVYRGGISRNIDGKTVQYAFLVDATNGDILEIDRESNQ